LPQNINQLWITFSNNGLLKKGTQVYRIPKSHQFYNNIHYILSSIIYLLPIRSIFPAVWQNYVFYGTDIPPISNGKVQELLLDASFNLESNETIAEGVNITVANPRIVLYSGTPQNEYVIRNLSGIDIAFQNAQPMGGSIKIEIPLDNISRTQYIYHNLPPGASFQIDENDIKHPIFPREPTYELNLSHGYIQGVIQNRPFSFSVSGDYSPSIILEFSNGSGESYTYDEIKFHVPSKSETQTQELNQINGFITIALFIFSLIELWRLISEWIGSKPSIKEEVVSTQEKTKSSNEDTKAHKNKT